MINKEDAVVLSVRTKYGENLLGFYVGENKQKLSGKDSVILYRPISIQYVEYFQNGKPFHNYNHNLYFPFGGTLVEILHEDIRNSEMANEFFSMYYTKILGEHIVNEENLQKTIIDYYDSVHVLMESILSYKILFVLSFSHYRAA